ncbi:unnamed protein product [Porites evermanni]|uniref:Uncharacterized protein n=1 Tax=Porites evermanni TaxID=104178 RepID=A0ABN8LWC6_9CNID|nr:unnamed protein product [Porites evermanni]
MGTKTTVAFSVIFMEDLEKRLLMANPSKPLVWKRFIDDNLSLCDSSVKEVYNFLTSLGFLRNCINCNTQLRSSSQHQWIHSSFADRNEALCNKAKQTKEILSFVTIYNPATLNLKKNLLKHRHIIQQKHKLKQIFTQPPIVSHRKKKSLNDILVRAKISIISQQSQNQQSG